MKFKGILLILTLLLALSSTAPAQNTEQLAKPIQLSTGQVAALTINAMNGFYKDMARWDTPVMAGYSEGKIEIAILGSRDSLDGAKESTSKYLKTILEPTINMLNGMYQLNLSFYDFRVTYRNNRKNKSLIKYENGNFYVL